jgi:3-oxoacyl-[acyl-carrier-protein] synthase III
MSAKTVRLAALATLIPRGRRSVADCVAAAGGSAMDAKVFSRLFGIDHVAVLPSDPDPVAMFVDMLAEAMTTCAPGALPPDTAIHVHGNPVQAGAAGELLQQLCDISPILSGLERCYEMDQQNCSTLFWAIEAAGALLESGAARSVAILVGDIMGVLPDSERYAPGCTAIGDAAAVMLLDGKAGGLRLGRPYLSTLPEHASGRFGTQAEIGAFNNCHTALVLRILSALGSDGPGCTRPILGHNVNRLSWGRFAKDTGTDPDRIWLELLPDIGHCYTLDALLMLPALLNKGGEEADLLSVGQGGFLAGSRFFVDRGHAYVYS